MRFLSALATGVLLALAGCTTGPATLSRSLDVKLGGFAEINLDMKAGETVSWDWHSSGIVHFDVHTHKDGKVSEPVAKDAAADVGTFTAPADGSYSLLWENNSRATIHVDYTVTTASHVDSQSPA